MNTDLINCGLEIEFSSNNYLDLLNELQANKIDFILTGNSREESSDKIIIKPESTVKGFEINIPPMTTYNLLELLCSIFSKYAIFTERCALHIHIGMGGNLTEEELDIANNEYIKYENIDIIEVSNKNLYVNLNKLNTDVMNKPGWKPAHVNLNVYNAYKIHTTFEHRVYKATFDYQELVWCINHTKFIINNISTILENTTNNLVD